ncbi:hypothetical protein ACQ4PT_035870 [Festuca glaucescens]
MENPNPGTDNIPPVDEPEASEGPTQQVEIVQENAPDIEIEMPEGVEQLTQEDINLFLEHESIVAAICSSHEDVSHHVPQMNMVFDTDDAAYDFYNEYAAIYDFSIKRAGKYNDKRVNARTYTCNRGGKVVDEKTKDERKKQKKEKKAEREGKPVPEAERKHNNVVEVT